MCVFFHFADYRYEILVGRTVFAWGITIGTVFLIVWPTTDPDRAAWIRIRSDLVHLVLLPRLHLHKKSHPEDYHQNVTLIETLLIIKIKRKMCPAFVDIHLMLTVFGSIFLYAVTSPNRKYVHRERNTVCDRIRWSICNAAGAHDTYRCIQMFDDLQQLEPIPALALLQYLWHLKQVLYLISLK